MLWYQNITISFEDLNKFGRGVGMFFYAVLGFIFSEKRFFRNVNDVIFTFFWALIDKRAVFSPGIFWNVPYSRCIALFLNIYNVREGKWVQNGIWGDWKKVLCVMCGYSGFKGKCVKSLVKIVCKRFGVYVVKHYFCTRIQERTAQQHDEGI